MPINKLALLRYRTIDKCLQNRFRKWTLGDLIDTVSDALYELEGIDSGVSKRTVQLDIQNMRSDKLGFNAPIVVMERKYYTYADKDYSITNTPVSDYDLEKLNEVVGILKQIKGFNYFKDLSSVVAKLEDKILKQKNEGVSYIDLDKNEQLKGLELIEPLHRAIRKKSPIKMLYQSFKAKEPLEQIIFPYLLKEYNNRWFLLCANKLNHENLLTLALDRMVSIEEYGRVKYREPLTDVFRFFEEVIGVSRTIKMRGRHILLKLKKSQLPYIITKPLHPSQSILEEENGWVNVSLNVVWNYELEREILGMGEAIEIVKPVGLRRKIKDRLEKTTSLYNEE
ncbi:MAG: WYL domain-containing protein [Bacteroidota bacterium]